MRFSSGPATNGTGGVNRRPPSTTPATSDGKGALVVTSKMGAVSPATRPTPRMAPVMTPGIAATAALSRWPRARTDTPSERRDGSRRADGHRSAGHRCLPHRHYVPIERINTLLLQVYSSICYNIPVTNTRPVGRFRTTRSRPEWRGLSLETHIAPVRDIESGRARGFRPTARSQSRSVPRAGR